MRTYARQPLRKPVELLNNMILEIQAGNFSPEEDSSSVAMPDHDGEAEQSDSDESLPKSCHGDDSVASNSEDEAIAVAVSFETSTSCLRGDERLFLNPRTGRLHLGKPGSSEKTACGKSLDTLEPQATGPIEDNDFLCKKCAKPWNSHLAD